MYKRKPVFAGSFYPSSPIELKGLISKYLSDAEDVPVRGEIVSLVVPHAGYIYSGPVAAYSYLKLAQMKPETVIVLALSHRARFNGASIIKDGVYDSPLGGIEIDSKITAGLLNNDLFAYDSRIHDSEHSLEVQVPFIKSVLDKAEMVPVIIGTVEINTIKEIADELASAISSSGKKCAILISTDLSHYHSYEQALDIDGRFISALESFDPEKVKLSIETESAEACGEGPILAGMYTSKFLGADRTSVLKYMNSGDTAGSRKEVVGYLSAAFVK